MSTPSIPLASAMNTPQDSLIAASPIYQALLAQTGGNLQNVNSLSASQPSFAPALSLMSPGGGLSPTQSSAFGPLFGLLMSLWGQGGQTPQPASGQGL